MAKMTGSRVLAGFLFAAALAVASACPASARVNLHGLVESGTGLVVGYDVGVAERDYDISHLSDGQSNVGWDRLTLESVDHSVVLGWRYERMLAVDLYVGGSRLNSLSEGLPAHAADATWTATSIHSNRAELSYGAACQFNMPTGYYDVEVGIGGGFMRTEYDDADANIIMANSTYSSVDVRRTDYWGTLLLEKDFGDLAPYLGGRWSTSILKLNFAGRAAGTPGFTAKYDEASNVGVVGGLRYRFSRNMFTYVEGSSGDAQGFGGGFQYNF